MARAESTKTHLENLVLTAQSTHGDTSGDTILQINTLNDDVNNATALFSIKNTGSFGVVGTAAIATALNMVTGVQPIPAFATVSAATEDGDARVVTIQCKDSGGTNDARVVRTAIWFSDTSGGNICTLGTMTSAAPSAGEYVWQKVRAHIIQTDTAGKFVFSVGQTGARTMYLNVVTAKGIITGNVSFA